MNKVYFDTENKHWYVSEPEDFYSFKSINYETNEENKNILSWTRGVDLKDYPNHIRMYDVEIGDVKYFFLMKQEKNVYKIEPENPIQLEKLVNNHNILFVGETMAS
jgi:hypothetical protein